MEQLNRPGGKCSCEGVIALHCIAEVILMTNLLGEVIMEAVSALSQRDRQAVPVEVVAADEFCCIMSMQEVRFAEISPSDVIL